MQAKNMCGNSCSGITLNASEQPFNILNVNFPENGFVEIVHLLKSQVGWSSTALK